MLSLSELLHQQEIIIFDGAMGTELQRRGVDVSLPLWSARAVTTAPEVVRTIHQDYVIAGAQVLTANTFRTTSFTYQRAGLDAKTARETARRAVFRAVSLAREAARSAPRLNVLVAGSLAPVGDCYSPGDYPGKDVARKIYRELAQWLSAAGAELLLLETHITLEEALIALAAAINTALPVLVSYLVNEDLQLWSGIPLEEAAKAAEGEGAQGVLINCVNLPIAGKGVEAMSKLIELPYGVCANTGRDTPTARGTTIRCVTDEEYVSAARHWRNLGARMIGGCCGTTPDTIMTLCRQLGTAKRN